MKGGVAGLRLGYDITSHFGLEGAYTYGVNNFRVLPDQTGTQRLQNFELGTRNHSLSLNPVWNFGAAGSKLRPYVTAGLGGITFAPTDAAGRNVRTNGASFGAAGVKNDLMPAFNWGGGIKYNVTQLLQLRFDARNIITRQPHLGLAPNNMIPGGIFAAPGGTASGLQATAGLGFNLGSLMGRSSASSAAADPSIGGGVRKNFGGKALRVNLAGGISPIAKGAFTKFTASTDAPDPAKVTYLWTVNGMGSDVTGPEFTFNSQGREPGDYKICATATSTAKDWAPGSECYTVTVSAPPRGLIATISESVKINAGESTKLNAGSDAPAGETVTYEWTVNGQAVPSATGPSYQFDSTGRQPGTYNVCVSASAHNVKSENVCSTVTVEACTNPAVSLGLAPGAEVFAGEKVSIPATVQPGSCKSPARISFRAGDGAIAGDAAGNSATGVFDSTNVAFDRTNRSKLQRKSVVVTVTATDEKGNTATAQTNVVVKLAPAAQRLDDVLFASRSSRVNNCGKRVLLEILTPRLRDDPEAKVVLIGHIDESENGNSAPARKNGRRRVATAVHLDKARVLNAAAVISGGEGICPALELNRVKVGYAGKAQGTEVRPTFCGSSTEVRATKRAGAKADTRAPYRRVEVWIVPSGAAMPAGVNLQDAPAAEVKALKCPK